MNQNSKISDAVTDEMVSDYRRDGFVRVPGIVDRREALEWGRAAERFAAEHADYNKKGGQDVFSQHVNAWQLDETMRRLTLDPRVAAAATRLAGVPLRLWHDQILIKAPRNGAATEFHQDQPYWPHTNSSHPISMWIALCDVPVERGCMTFIPGSQVRTDLRAQDLGDAGSLMSICPDFRWRPRVTVPLRAGDCTFHHGRCAHMATPNHTDEPRIAHVAIFVDRGTAFSGEAGHGVTDALELEPGQTLPDAPFPPIG
ncbi:MAG: phytanoyl-CoA dioxygenase family protein [Planctomycetota bacterium]